MIDCLLVEEYLLRPRIYSSSVTIIRIATGDSISTRNLVFLR